MAADRLDETPLCELYDDDTYGTVRSDAGLLLDLLGHLEGGDARLDVLRTAAAHADPWIALWAVRPLIGTGHELSASDIERIAAYPAARIILLGELMSIGQFDSAPPQHRTQAAIAGSDMVRWLTYPTELARPPDEIDLLGRATLDDAGHPADLFLFKFRTHPPHWSTDKEWMVGAAGPYRQADQPTLTAGGLTFSTFAQLDEMSLAEHIEALAGTVTAWADAHGAGPLPTLQKKGSGRSFLRKMLGR